MKEIIKLLKEIKNQLEIFSKIVKKYPLGHNYYKNNLKRVHLDLRGKLLKIRTLKTDKTSEIDTALISFLSMTSPSQKNCEELTDKINYFIQELEIDLEATQDDFIERVYDKNSPFDFHIDIKNIIENVENEIFIIEPFVTDHLLEVTLKDINKNIKIRILTNSHNADKRGAFSKLSNLFSKQVKSYEVRESEDIHDRGIFVDDCAGWVMGQSIKDGGKKPTYIIKLRDSKRLESIYQKIWNSATKVK